ncbi:MAG: ABC transporter permease subunit [Gemmatimonadetes bacterium]|nr:ABC transporter permease subunit [Gemmatimonadota bacterium]
MTSAREAARRSVRRRTIVLHELRTQLRSAPFAALLLMLVGAASALNPVAMIPGGSDATLPVRAVANSVYALAPTFAMSAFFVYPFFASLMAGLSVLRDEESGVAELVHSTPLTRAEYMWGKFAGVCLALLLVVAVHLLVVIGFRELGAGGVLRGPFHLSAYLQPVVWFVVPGVLWTAGLTFAVGARTRAPMAVYVLPVGLFVLEFFLLWNWHPRGIAPALDAALMIVDPTGLRWLTHALFAVERDMTWYNSAPLAVDRVILAGRLVTVLLPLVAVAWVARRHRAPAAAGRRARSWRRRAGATVDAAPVASSSPAHVRPVAAMRMRTPSALRATATVWTAECRTLLRQPSVYLFAALLFAVVTEVGGTEVDPYGSTAVLTAGGIAVAALPVVTVLTCLFLLFVVVESMHRDRATGFDVIALSTPVPTTAFLAGKALAAGTLIAVVTLVCVAGSGALLLAQSGTAASWWPLWLVFGGVLVPTYVLWVSFVTAVATVARTRPTALAVGLVALLVTAAQFMRGAMTWLSNWPLWGALRWTEFAVFPLDGDALLLNRVFALGMALALFGAARLLFVRTESDPRAVRRRRSRSALRQLAVRVVPFAVLPLFTGTFLAVRVQHAHDAPGARPVFAEAQIAPAVITHVDADVRVVPAQRRLDIVGAYDLVNHAAGAVSALPFTVPPSFGAVSWQVDGMSVTASGFDGRLTVPLPSPVPPGGRVRVAFAYTAHVNAGISRNGGPVAAFVLPAGLLVSTHRGDFLPVPGHRAAGASLRPAVHRASGEAASAPPGNLDSPTDSQPVGAGDRPDDSFNRGWAFTVVVRVQAPRALRVNGVGERTASVVVGNEVRTVWESRVSVAALSLVGATYAERRAPGVAVYHHPMHTRSLDVITSTLAAARQRFDAWFAPYPWTELRLSEYPDLSTQATSYPTSIAFSEGLGFLTVDGPDGGLAFAVTAHEAAHQWWGHLLTADNGPGSGVLVEGMADFATLLLYDAERGAAARQRYATVLEQQYLEARSAARERPLLALREDTDADATILQKKGAWAMYMLYRQLGPERTFPALRAFIAAHRAPGQFATTESLLRTLRTHASDTIAFDAEVARWFRGVGLPAFSVQDPRCTAVAGTTAALMSTDGRWRCAATVRNDGTTGATVDVGAMTAGRSVPGGVQRVHLEPGARAALAWTLMQRPDRIVVDPDVQLLQAGRERAGAAVPR